VKLKLTSLNTRTSCVDRGTISGIYWLNLLVLLKRNQLKAAYAGLLFLAGLPAWSVIWF